MDNLIHEYEPLWGSWYIENLIGEGNYGSVYKIKKTEYNKVSYSVLKIISIPKNQKEIDKVIMEGIDPISARNYFKELTDSLYPEIEWLCQIEQDSNIVKYEDYQVIPKEDNVGYDILIRMELLKSLTSYVMEQELLISDVIKMGKDLTKALMVSRQYDKVHRDIKPENIFVTPDGDYKLGDFGIAKRLGDFNLGMSVNCMFEYMAPEIYLGTDYDERADIYSLGIVLYTYLNHRKPPFLSNVPMIKFDERNKAIKLRLDGKQIEPLEFLSEHLGKIVLKACSYQPEDRYASAEEFYRELCSLKKVDTMTREEASELNYKQIKKENQESHIVCLNFSSSGYVKKQNKLGAIQTDKNLPDWKQVVLPYIQPDNNVTKKSLQKTIIIVCAVVMIVMSIVASDFIYFMAKDWYFDNIVSKKQVTANLDEPVLSNKPIRA